MGLGTVNNNTGVFLSIAGGYIWNRKAEETDSNYATQEYTKADKTTGVRKGARYQDLTGTITGVQFKTHQEYGENINVNFEDEDGGKYIISISTNNRYSQDMMKALLKADLSKEIFVKPFDFLDKDKKRVMGISFRQNGEKINLRNEDAPSKDPDWFKNSTKKLIKRFFEDLTEWLVEEVEEKVCSQFSDTKAKEKSEAKTAEKPKEVEKTEEKKEPQKVTPLKMKKAIKAYIVKNYKGEEMPNLSKDELVKWYNFVLADDELPFSDEEDNEPDSTVERSKIDGQLDALLKK